MANRYNNTTLEFSDFEDMSFESTRTAGPNEELIQEKRNTADNSPVNNKERAFGEDWGISHQPKVSPTSGQTLDKVVCMP